MNPNKLASRRFLLTILECAVYWLVPFGYGDFGACPSVDNGAWSAYLPGCTYQGVSFKVHPGGWTAGVAIFAIVLSLLGLAQLRVRGAIKAGTQPKIAAISKAGAGMLFLPALVGSIFAFSAQLSLAALSLLLYVIPCYALFLTLRGADLRGGITPQAGTMPEKPARRRGKGKKVQEMTEAEREGLLGRLRDILSVSTRVDIARVAQALKIDSQVIWDRIFDWAKQFGFKIDGDFIVVEELDVESFIRALDKEFLTWKSDGKV